MYSCKHPGRIWSHLFLCGFSASTCTEWLLLQMGELEKGEVGPSSKRWAIHTKPEVWECQCGQQKMPIYSSCHPYPILLTPGMKWPQTADSPDMCEGCTVWILSRMTTSRQHPPQPNPFPTSEVLREGKCSHEGMWTPTMCRELFLGSALQLWICSAVICLPGAVKECF